MGVSLVVAEAIVACLNPICMGLLAAFGTAYVYNYAKQDKGYNPDNQAIVLEKSRDKDNNKAEVKQKVSATPAGDPNNDDDKKHDNLESDDNKTEKFKWEIKDPKDADKIMRHDRFGKFYKDPSQKIANKDIWWSKDTAGHGGSKYKLFIEKANKLEWIADIDEFGNIINKQKGIVGKIIDKKDLIGIK